MQKFHLLFLFFWISQLTTAQIVIEVEAKDIGLYYQVSKERDVSQVYFGHRLSKTALEETVHCTVLGSPLRDAPVSTLGTRDLSELSLEMIHADGNLTSIFKFEDIHRRLISSDVIETEIVLKDSYYPFKMRIIYTAYIEENVITVRNVLENQEKGTVIIHKAASSLLNFHDNDYYLTQFTGWWGNEMGMHEEHLERGLTSIETKRGVRATMSENPAFILSFDSPVQETSGKVMLGALAWSGNFKSTFEVDANGKLSLVSGINDFFSDYHLPSGKTFETPSFVFTYSNHGSGQATRSLQTWCRKYSLRDGDTVRPIVLNSWEGTHFDFNEEVIKKMIDKASDLGIELFVLDDGWFGNHYPRNNDKQGLGDWIVNKSKLPHGLSELIHYASARGLKFGLWIEPEMVNMKSDLAQSHPEWILGNNDHRPLLEVRNQCILDMTNPQVQNYIFDIYDQIMRENPDISYIKWDANAHLLNPSSSFLSAEDQSQLYIDNVKGLYKVYDRIVKKYPQVMMQVCASGGGRLDYGSLKYHHEFWTSDNTDALSRLFIQWGTSFFYPSMAMAAHISKPNTNFTKSMTSLKFRADVAMSGRLGIELQPDDLSASDYHELKGVIDTYKQIRGIVQLGNLYRLLSPYKNARSAIMYVGKDKELAVVFAYCHKTFYDDDYFNLQLDGLDENGYYQLTEINHTDDSPHQPFAEGGIFSGEFLMTHGITLFLHNLASSVVFKLTKVKNN